MNRIEVTASPHRRRNALTGEWILVSPSRSSRPWLGHRQPAPVPSFLPTYDPGCYLCPGNRRAGGSKVNPIYTETFVFENDFPALQAETPLGRIDRSGLQVAEALRGICRVVCFSPRHDLTMATLEVVQMRRVVETWIAQTQELSKILGIGHVQIFENRGNLMGASNPHPHGQIWADGSLPRELARESEEQRSYRARNGSCLLCDYLEMELYQNQRVVHQNDHFVALVPFWATWPFELLLLSRAHRSALSALDQAERASLAAILPRIARSYDRLFQAPFPYTMGFHQQPSGAPHPEWHLHGHYYPPLLRSADVPKFMTGYELLAQPQRDLSPEAAAEQLRAVAI
jgi:UDPglucose--hexose-1-phosphate uridylyltransferase